MLRAEVADTAVPAPVLKRPAAPKDKEWLHGWDAELQLPKRKKGSVTELGEVVVSPKALPTDTVFAKFASGPDAWEYANTSVTVAPLRIIPYFFLIWVSMSTMVDRGRPWSTMVDHGRP